VKASILIAVKGANEHLKECLAHCLGQTHQECEVLVLPDAAFACDDPRVRIIPTGPRLPADKRDAGARHARGEVLAFLDDDAYPDKNWLASALALFAQDPQVAAVAGPAITPSDEPVRRRASGMVYESAAMSGSYRYRYAPAKRRMIDDYPSCNLLVRKEVFFKLGGFRTNFWPGEDTILCLGIVKGLGLKIVYDPAVLVYHHRRPLFGPHLCQIAGYATHRGYFVKRYPQTSRRWSYCMPSLFVVFLIGGPFLLPADLFLVLLGTYGLAVLLGSLHARRPGLIALTILGIITSHLTYGVFFLRGLFSPRLKEET